MKETLISIKVAKLAREKGYIFTGNLAGFTMNKPEVINLPTQSLLQKWLRDEKSIHITVWYSTVAKNFNVHCYHELYEDIESEVGYFYDYETALEHGLEQAIILDK